MDKETIEHFFQRTCIAYYQKYLPDLKKIGRNYMATCPFHDDHTPSLCIYDEKGSFKCFGCDAKGDKYDFYAKQHNLDSRADFRKIINGIAGDFGITNGDRPEKSKVVARYDYEDESGHLLCQIERSEPKNFRIRQPDGRGGWIYKKGDVSIAPYRLPALKDTREILIAEGEKDADNLAALGFAATTNPFGAGKWPEHFAPYFAGKDVVLIPDNDEPGRRHMRMVAENLKKCAASIRWLELPDLPPKGDASDFIAKFSEKEAAERLASLIAGAPPYEPADDEIQTDDNCSDGDDERNVVSLVKTTSIIGVDPLAWPAPLDKAAYHGVIGEWVKRVEPNTESDPASLLFQGLASYGNIFGPNAHFMVEATEHHCNENVLLVGTTSKGRKGTSWDHVKRTSTAVDPSWTSECIKSGLTSGEGLIYHVRDPREKQGKIPADEGVADKRLLVHEGEFANVLKTIERKDNTLSATIRDAWDHGNLRTLAKNVPVKATGAHISIISHVTKAELMARLSTTESFNGFANRFIFVCVRRSKLLPEGGGTVNLSGILPKLQDAINFAHKTHEIRRDEDARNVWASIYGELTRDRSGILGSVLARDAAHVVRLSMIYALLDCSAVIRREHLEAALACWEYAESSARFIFESMTGDPIADKIYNAVQVAGRTGIPRTFINNNLFQRNVASDRIDQAVELLRIMDRVKVDVIQTGGRQEKRICAIC